MTESATAILDRFLQHAQIISITGKSYRLRQGGAGGKAGDVARKKGRPAAGGGESSPPEDSGDVTPLSSEAAAAVSG